MPQRREQIIEKAKALYPLDYVSSPDNASAMEDADVALFCAAAPVPLLESGPVKELSLIHIYCSEPDAAGQRPGRAIAVFF